MMMNYDNDNDSCGYDDDDGDDDDENNNNNDQMMIMMTMARMIFLFLFYIDKAYVCHQTKADIEASREISRAKRSFRFKYTVVISI